MRKTHRIFLLVWIAVASWSLSRWWLGTQGNVINLPASVWNWLADLYGVTNAEQGADLEGVVGLSGSLVFVTLLTCLAEGLARWLWWRRGRRQFSQQSATQSDFKQMAAHWVFSCVKTVYFLLIGVWSLVFTFNVLESLEAANRLPLLLFSSERRTLLSFIVSTVFVFTLSWLVLRLGRNYLCKLRRRF